MAFCSENHSFFRLRSITCNLASENFLSPRLLSCSYIYIYTVYTHPRDPRDVLNCPNCISFQCSKNSTQQFRKILPTPKASATTFFDQKTSSYRILGDKNWYSYLPYWMVELWRNHFWMSNIQKRMVKKPEALWNVKKHTGNPGFSGKTAKGKLTNASSSNRSTSGGAVNICQQKNRHMEKQATAWTPPKGPPEVEHFREGDESEPLGLSQNW